MNEVSVISERIRGFILEKFPLAVKRALKDTDPLLESGIVDSLGVLDLVAFVEKEFAILVVDEELLPENFQSIDRLAAFVRRKADAASGPPV